MAVSVRVSAIVAFAEKTRSGAWVFFCRTRLESVFVAVSPEPPRCREIDRLLDAPWGRGTSGACARQISPPGCSPSAPRCRGSGSCCLAPVVAKRGVGEVSGNAETQAIARRWAHSRDRGGALFSRRSGVRRDRTSTNLDDDEGATELIERETHLADVRARPNVRGATRCVGLLRVRGEPSECLTFATFCRAFEICRKCVWVLLDRAVNRGLVWRRSLRCGPKFFAGRCSRSSRESVLEPSRSPPLSLFASHLRALPSGLSSR
jgi:hypothetical protein